MDAQEQLKLYFKNHDQAKIVIKQEEGSKFAEHRERMALDPLLKKHLTICIDIVGVLLAEIQVSG